MTQKQLVTDLASLRQSDPALYRLSIRGELDECWADYLNAVCVTRDARLTQPASQTLICGVADQAQLMGVLHMLQSWGVVLEQLECIATVHIKRTTASNAFFRA